MAVVLAKDRSMHTMIKDNNLVWPDGVSYNQVDGYMYVSAAQVNRGAAFNDGKSVAKNHFIFLDLSLL